MLLIEAGEEVAYLEDSYIHSQKISIIRRPSFGMDLYCILYAQQLHDVRSNMPFVMLERAHG